MNTEQRFDEFVDTPGPGERGAHAQTSERQHVNGSTGKSTRRKKPKLVGWLSQCQLDRSGFPLPNLANALVALRQEPAIREAFAYDEMFCGSFLTRSLTHAANFKPRATTDTDALELQEWLQRNGLPLIGKAAVDSAIDVRSRELAFHPIRHYLGALQWDGRHRVRDLFPNYFGTERSCYSEVVGEMFLVSMVARVFKPGCQADYMIILESRTQGELKSSACRTLAGDEWFSDHLPDIARGGKDLSQHLRGKWLVEMPELSAMGKAEAEQLKAFITRRIERYRPSYGRREVVEPRQCVLIGTTNQSAYLKDETGNRRFWPVKVSTVDIQSLGRDRDQLFAEAVNLFNGGVHWWPDRNFERDHIAPEQEARFESDPWEEIIAPYLGTQTKVTLTQVAREALHIEDQKVGKREQNRISACLRHLKWKSRNKVEHPNKRWWDPL